MQDRLQDVVQQQIGERYRVEREIGHGGMGRVFLATDVALGRSVAVKVLRPELASRVSAERFRQEVHVTLELQHPHVLPLLDAGGTDDARLETLRYYVTPYVEGETLRQRLALGGPLPVGEALRLLAETADAVAYAHAHGVAHRDVKPENVLLSAGHAVLADFGVARAIGATAGDAERLTGSETEIGTRGYLPPDDRDPFASDVYALGVVGYEMLAGRRPAASPDDPQWIAALPEETPDAVVTALAAALRPGGALDAAALRDAVVGAPAGVGREARARLWSRRRGAALGATLVIAAAVAAVAAYVRPRDPALDPRLVAVAPFRVSDEAFASWREDMVEWVYRNLDGAGAVRAVPTARALRAWRTDAADPARAFGRATGARYVVSGSLVPLGDDSVRVAATLSDAGTGERVDDFEVRVATDQLNHAPDSLTLWVLRGLNRVLPMGAVRTRDAAFGARSIPALKAFFRGEAEYRANRWDEARAHYERALQLDPGFALAMRRMRGVLRVHDELDPRSLDFALAAGQANRGLGPRDSMLVAADSVLAAVMREPRSVERRVGKE
jgi:serine/threonine-protein kinase